MTTTWCRGEPKEALTYLVCAIPLIGSFLGKGGKWLKSVGADLVTKGIKKGEDLVSSLRVTYRVAADKVAGMQKYLDDIFEHMAAARMGNGQYRLCFAGGYLDDGSRLMYEIQDDAGRTLSRISRMDDLADPKVLKELGGAGHLDDVDDIIAAAKGLDDVNVPKGLDGTGGEIEVDNYARVNRGDSNAKNPMTGDEWHNYFNETYGADNVTWESASIQDIVDMPSKITDFSPKQISDLATKEGWTVEPLGKGSLAGIPYEQGGGLSLHAPNGSSVYIQYHPGGGHHGEMPYYKVSSGKNGIVRYYINGERAK